jgi:16S rRNA (cytidine1402-2'-O)-methyltransferase
MKKGLYIIATPIGNLGDITERAVEILKDSEIIACEDTRVTKKLFSLLGISLKNRKFIPLHDHNEQQMSQELINCINENNAVALVSDAGSPLISDPGYKLVRMCRKQNIPVYTIPGSCAVICALQISGLPTNRFMFAGFIPNKEKARENLFYELANVNTTLVFYETASRLLKTLTVAAKIFKNREFSITRELTKMYEECLTGSAEDLIKHYTEIPPKGEIVFMVAPPLEKKVDDIDLNSVLKSKMAGKPLKTAVSEAVKEYGFNKSEAYSLALKIKNEM